MPSMICNSSITPADKSQRHAHVATTATGCEHQRISHLECEAMQVPDVAVVEEGQHEGQNIGYELCVVEDRPLPLPGCMCAKTLQR
eukprot:scaffold634044_cov44-Prasinocladus_malaysianus.AAC.1